MILSHPNQQVYQRILLTDFMVNRPRCKLSGSSLAATQNSLMPLEWITLLKTLKAKVDLRVTNKLRVASRDKITGRTDHLACDFNYV